MIQQPIKLAPLPADGCRDITPAETVYYKSLAESYRIKCLANPCDRGLRSYWKCLLGIVESGKIGTREGLKKPADPD